MFAGDLSTDGLYTPVLPYIAPADILQQPVQTGSAQHLMLKFQ